MNEEYFAHHHIAPFFHRQVRRLINTLRDGTFPAAQFKRYPRLPQFPLGEASLPDSPLQDLLTGRKSARSFEKTHALTERDLSSVLRYGFGAHSTRDAGMRAHYPSGGARYPLECYVLLQKSDTIPPGLYHYQPVDHVLAQLLEQDAAERLTTSVLTYEFSGHAPAIVILTAQWRRNFIKYKDFGYPLILLEAGHAAQNALLVAQSLGLRACSLAGFRYDETCTLLDIDGIFEAPLHMIALGRSRE